MERRSPQPKGKGAQRTAKGADASARARSSKHAPSKREVGSPRPRPKGRGGAIVAKAEAPATRGRPPGSKVPTGERLERMLDYIRGGVTPWVAAQSIGINPRTFREWMV